MSNLEERRVSFVAASSKDGENKRGPSPAPSDSRKNGSLSGSTSKDKKSKGQKCFYICLPKPKFGGCELINTT